MFTLMAALSGSLAKEPYGKIHTLIIHYNFIGSSTHAKCLACIKSNSNEFQIKARQNEFFALILITLRKQRRKVSSNCG